jgi:hypothetical protein
VTRLRSASCRSRASRSSGNLTVVRFMYASIPSTALVLSGDAPTRTRASVGGGAGDPQRAPIAAG